MSRSLVKDLNRCPFCKSSDIYKRIRARWTDKDRHKKYNIIDKKIFICHSCKKEFDNPIKL